MKSGKVDKALLEKLKVVTNLEPMLTNVLDYYKRNDRTDQHIETGIFDQAVLRFIQTMRKTLKKMEKTQTAECNMQMYERKVYIRSYIIRILDEYLQIDDSKSEEKKTRDLIKLFVAKQIKNKCVDANSS